MDKGIIKDSVDYDLTRSLKNSIIENNRIIKKQKLKNNEDIRKGCKEKHNFALV